MTSKNDVLSKYKIIKSLGEGAFGEAKLAKDKEDGKFVVIKIVNLEALDEEQEEKAINEGNILRKVSKDLEHDNIVNFMVFIFSLQKLY
jgi:serine/threonine protein kinase